MDSQTSLLDMGVPSDSQLISEQSTQEITFSNLPSIPNGNAVSVLLEIKHQRTGQLHFDSVSNVTAGEVYELDLSDFGTPIELTAYLDLLKWYLASGAGTFLCACSPRSEDNTSTCEGWISRNVLGAKRGELSHFFSHCPQERACRAACRDDVFRDK